MMKLTLALLLPLLTAAFVLGLILPLMYLERLYFLVDTPSLLEVVLGLWGGGDKALAGAVGLFSIVFPALKILSLHLAAIGGGEIRGLGALCALGKWSMMDVLLVALVIFAAKTSGLASAVSQPGLWFYAGATVMTAVAAQILRRIA